MAALLVALFAIAAARRLAAERGRGTLRLDVGAAAGARRPGAAAQRRAPAAAARRPRLADAGDPARAAGGGGGGHDRCRAAAGDGAGAAGRRRRRPRRAGLERRDDAGAPRRRGGGAAAAAPLAAAGTLPRRAPARAAGARRGRRRAPRRRGPARRAALAARRAGRGAPPRPRPAARFRRAAAGRRDARRREPGLGGGAAAREVPRPHRRPRLDPRQLGAPAARRARRHRHAARPRRRPCDGFPVRAGIDTGEWAAGRPDVAAAPPRRRAGAVALLGRRRLLRPGATARGGRSRSRSLRPPVRIERDPALPPEVLAAPIHRAALELRRPSTSLLPAGARRSVPRHPRPPAVPPRRLLWLQRAVRGARRAPARARGDRRRARRPRAPGRRRPRRARTSASAPLEPVLAAGLALVLAHRVARQLLAARPLLGAASSPRRPSAVFFVLPLLAYLALLPWSAARRAAGRRRAVLPAHHPQPGPRPRRRPDEQLRRRRLAALHGPADRAAARRSGRPARRALLAPQRAAAAGARPGLRGRRASSARWRRWRPSPPRSPGRRCASPATTCRAGRARPSPPTRWSPSRRRCCSTPHQVWVEVPAALLAALALDRIRELPAAAPGAAATGWGSACRSSCCRCSRSASCSSPRRSCSSPGGAPGGRAGRCSRSRALLAAVGGGMLLYNQLLYGNPLKIHTLERARADALRARSTTCSAGSASSSTPPSASSRRRRSGSCCCRRPSCSPAAAGRSSPTSRCSSCPTCSSWLPRPEWYGGWSPPFRYALIGAAAPRARRGVALRAARGAPAPALLLAGLGALTLVLTLLWIAVPGWTYNFADGRTYLLDHLGERLGADVARLFPSSVRPRAGHLALAARRGGRGAGALGLARPPRGRRSSRGAAARASPRCSSRPPPCRSLAARAADPHGRDRGPAGGEERRPPPPRALGDRAHALPRRLGAARRRAAGGAGRRRRPARAHHAPREFIRNQPVPFALDVRAGGTPPRHLAAGARAASGSGWSSAPSTGRRASRWSSRPSGRTRRGRSTACCSTGWSSTGLTGDRASCAVVRAIARPEPLGVVPPRRVLGRRCLRHRRESPSRSSSSTRARTACRAAAPASPTASSGPAATSASPPARTSACAADAAAEWLATVNDDAVVEPGWAAALSIAALDPATRRRRGAGREPAPRRPRPSPTAAASPGTAAGRRSSSATASRRRPPPTRRARSSASRPPPPSTAARRSRAVALADGDALRRAPRLLLRGRRPRRAGCAPPAGRALRCRRRGRATPARRPARAARRRALGGVYGNRYLVLARLLGARLLAAPAGARSPATSSTSCAPPLARRPRRASPASRPAGRAPRGACPPSRAAARPRRRRSPRSQRACGYARGRDASPLLTRRRRPLAQRGAPRRAARRPGRATRASS